MKILALDISSKRTGWFITKKSCGLITVPSQLSFHEKLVYFRKELIKLLKKYKPDVVVIEDVYYRPAKGSIHTVKTLSQLGGVAAEASVVYGAQVEVITATQARKHCCGDREGSFKKPEVFEFFVQKYKLTDWTFGNYNDITDAMALSFGYKEMQKVKKKSRN